ncbi:MAG: glycosyltransferase family 1 protein [Verrucomicrobia bacterium]|nr:MAG: glycosyltransferase family 1 protein [Verrucomicrobiota bacterium]
MTKAAATGAKMRIAVWHNLPSGGGKRTLYYHIRGLVKRGHSVEAWCPSTSDRNYLPLSELITEHIVPIDIRQRGKAVIRSSWLGVLHGDELREAKALDQHCRTCADEINRGNFDILFANASIIQAVSSIGRYVKKTKVLYLGEPNRWLYEARADGLPWIAIPAVSQPWMHPRYVRWFLLNLIRTQQLRVLARDERLNARAFDLILVNSYFSRESLLRAYGLDSTVCYPGADTQLFVNHQHARENFVVGMGELSPHKNVEFIIKAVAQIAVPRPRLVWIANMGFESYYEEMRRLAESYGVSFEARTGIGDDELVETLNRAAAMVYASRLEPLGLAPLEANACGLPVVAVAEGGVRETIIDGVTGLLVQHQPQAMARAIEQLRDDKRLTAQLSKNGSELVKEKWSVESAVERLERQLSQAFDA